MRGRIKLGPATNFLHFSAPTHLNTMKIGFTIFLAASLLVIVIGKPVVSQSSAEKSLSRWDAERQAVALLESQLAAHGQGIAPAQPNDIVQLESQWALRLAAPLGVPTHFAAFGPFESRALYFLISLCD